MNVTPNTPDINMLDVHVTYKNNEFLVDINSKNSFTNDEKDQIKNKIILICKSILGQITNKDIQQIDFSFQPNQHSKVRLISKDQTVDAQEITVFTGAAKKESVALVSLVEKIGRDHLNKSSAPRPEDSSGIYETIKRCFQRTWLYYNTINPTAKSMVNEVVKGKNSQQLEELYKNPSALFATIKSKILTDEPAYRKAYGSAEVDTIIQAQLLEGIQGRLKALKEPLLTEKSLHRLEIARDLTHLKNHSYTTDSISEAIFDRLSKISPLDIPIDLLKEIPITDFNKHQLADLWSNTLGNLFSKGHLDKLAMDTNKKGAIVQEHYASRYLNTLVSLPTALQNITIPSGETLESLCKYLDEKQSATVIKDFVIQRSGLPSRDTEKADIVKTNQPIQSFIDKIKSDLAPLAKEQRFFDAQITPALKKLRKEMEESNALEIAENLIQEKPTFLKNFIDNVHSKMSSEQMVKFDESRLKKIFYNELESILLFDYQFTSTQLESLRQLRSNKLQESTHSIKITEAMKQFVKDLQTIQNSKGHLSFEKDQLQEYSTTTIPFIKFLSLRKVDVIKDAYMKKVESANIQNDKEIASLNITKADLDAKFARAQSIKGRDKIKIFRELVAVKNQLAELNMKKAVLGDALKAHKDGDTEKLLTALSLVTISVGSKQYETTNIDSIDKEGLDTLKSINKRLQSELKKLREEQSPDEVKAAKIQLLTNQIQQLDKFLAGVEKIEPLKAEIAARASKLKENIDNLKTKARLWYQDLLKRGVSVEALASLEPLKSFKELPTEFIVTLWEETLTHLFQKTGLNKLSNDRVLDIEIKSQMKEYLRAKTVLKGLSTINSEAHAALNKHIEKLESQFTQPDIKAHLATSVGASPSVTTNDILFSDEIVRAVQNNKQAKFSVFTAMQQADLMYLTRALNKTENQITVEEKNEIKNILARIANEPKMKQLIALHQDGPSNKIDPNNFPWIMRQILGRFMGSPSEGVKLQAGVSSDTMEFLSKYLTAQEKIKKTKFKEVVGRGIINKTKSIIEKYLKKEKINSEDRLSIKEISTLSSLARTYDETLIANMHRLGLDDLGIMAMHNLSKEAKEQMDKLQGIIKPLMDQHYTSGSLLAHVSSKEAAWKGRKPDIEEQLTAYIGNGLTHGAKLFHNSEGEITISHVIGEYDQAPLSIYELCISDIWALDVVPLMDSSLHPYLKDLYGDDWKSKINLKYQNIEKSLHNQGDKRFDAIKNDHERRIQAGLADYSWLRFLGVKNVQGHQVEQSDQFATLHHQILKGEPLKGKQICSEFASRSTAAAMIELNERLRTELLNKNPSLDGSAVVGTLKRAGIEVPANVSEFLLNGSRKNSAQDRADLVKILKSASTLYSKEQINLIIRIASHEIFDLPYSKKERFEAIHPGRMIKLLDDKGCVKRVAPPAGVSELLDIK